MAPGGKRKVRAEGALLRAQEAVKVRVMKYKSFSPTVSDVFMRRGWVSVDEGDDWDIFFCDMVQLRDLFGQGSRPLRDHQRVGHFRNNYEISRKHFMAWNLKNLKSRIEKAFGRNEGKKCSFFPTTFILPMEESSFLQEYLYKPSCYWIIKPAAGAHGRGIFIFRGIKDYYDWREKLISKPRTPPPTAIGTPPPGQFYVKCLAQTSYLMARLQISTPDNPKKAEEEPVTSEVTEVKSEVTEVNDPKPEIDPVVEKSESRSCELPESSSKDDLSGSVPVIEGGGRRVTSEGGSRNEVYVIQKYIANPYLIDGKKFDLRFFVLVTSFNPLKAWMYREGFARFSQRQFSLDTLQDVYIHLTNVAIQRTAEDYNPAIGSKWSLGKLREYMTTRHGEVAIQELMNQIDNIVVRTLQSVHQLIIQDSHCFEIYGFDVLIDDELQPWLLEVNCSPAFTPSNEEDYWLKSALIDDTINVLDLEEKLTGYEKRVGGFDLIWDDGPVYSQCPVPGDCLLDGGPKLNSFLGCLNDRNTQLCSIFANAQFLRKGPHKCTNKCFVETVPVHAPTTRYHLNSSRQDVLDDRFRMPSMVPPVFVPPVVQSQPSTVSARPITAAHRLPLLPVLAASEAPPLIVVGKAIKAKRNSTKLVRRSCAETLPKNKILF